MIDKSIFFRTVRANPFKGSLTKGQVEGMEKIIDYWENEYSRITLDQFAYVLATIFHETGAKMVPVREGGGEAYLRTKKYYPWVGEGLVQVTWEENAKRFGAKKPGDLMSWPIALFACFEGMTKGIFTRKRLDDYIRLGQRDYVGARRIINGTDRALMIAGYASAFRTALLAASVKPEQAPVPTQINPVPEAFDRETFKAWLLEAMQSDEDVRAAVIAIVFPDDPAEAYDPADEPHEEYGEPSQVAYLGSETDELDPTYG